MSRSRSRWEGGVGNACDKPGKINLHDGFTVGPRYDYCYYMIIAIIARRQSVRGFFIAIFFSPRHVTAAAGARYSIFDF